MTTLFLTHPAALQHVTPSGHPERVDRLEAIYAALRHADLDRRTAPLADEAEVLRGHSAAYLAAISRARPEAGWEQLDPDTFMSPGSWEAALRAIGGVEAAVDAILSGEAKNAFVTMRPPGHHAERARSMGFCLFGTVAIAAKYALDHHGLSRVAVLDFDVHHGNGTQDLLWDEARATFVSSQQMPLWPGTGAADEVGAHGQVINLPLPPGSGGTEMRAAWEAALARVAVFRPDLILVSAGFDAHRDDPLANLNWTEADYGWITHAICDLADDCCGGRVVSALEGGYDLDALSASVATHVRVLMERGE
ncbi:MAG: acetoin utilization protein [Rhodobacterales bacterium 32-67-9]|nr:MAG: acetoin utilization protein [Rhodobacterales bacterium 32-67-9]